MSTVVFEDIHSPAWADSEHSAVTLLVKVAGVGQTIPFTASPDDSEQYGIDLYCQAIAGEFGPIGPYVAPSGSAVLSQRAIESARTMAIVQTEIAPLVAAESLGEATPEELEQLVALQRELVDLYRNAQAAMARSQAEVSHAP